MLSSPDPPVALRPPTSPLRLPKRDTSAALARRSSSSYKHVRNNNLVSNSPFKSIQPPSPRRVSGEKRPRPISFADQADAERTFAYKRERRQSKGFQGLIQNEPVTRSPFKRTPLPRSSSPLPPESHSCESHPPPVLPDAPLPTPHPHTSPTRSSLVSHRMHGPRASGSGRDSLGGRRNRRKRVTFHEECDVVEFEPDEQSDPASEHLDDDGFFGNPDHDHEQEQEEDSYEDIPLEPISIDSVLHTTNSFAPSPPTTSFPQSMPAAFPFSLPTHAESTPPSPPPRKHKVQHAEDEEREDSYDGQIDLTSIESLLHSSFSKHPESTPPSTPPRSRIVLPSARPAFSTESKIPLRKSTHADRLRATPAPPSAGMEHAVRMLPPSPSPIKDKNTAPTSPIYFPQKSDDHFTLDEHVPEPQMLPQLKDEPPLDLSFLSHSNNSIDAQNLSAVHSEVSHAGIDVSLEAKDTDMQVDAIKDLVAPSEEDTSFSSCESRDFVTDDVPTHATASPVPSGSLDSLTGRPRISRADVHRRLLEKRGDDEAMIDADNHVEERDRKADTISVLTDTSAETATIETAEKRLVGLGNKHPITVDASLLPIPPSTNTGPSLNFDFGSKFGRGLGMRMDDLGAGSGVVSETGVRMDAPQLDMNVDMRSALDRLMDDVAGGPDARRHALAGTPDDSMTTSLAEDSMATDDHAGATLRPSRPVSVPMERAATDSALLSGSGVASLNGQPMPSRSASVSSIPPPPPPKDAIRSREEMVLEKRRQARQQEEDESQGYYTPPKTGLGGRRVPAHMLAVVNGRPSRRRSMSTGDMEELNGAARREVLLDVATFAAEEDPLADSIDRELRKLKKSPSKKSKYHVREQEGMIYASSDADRISHMDSAGDVDGGKAWRTVRRPSDMNEYSKQIKAFRAQEKPGKTHGKVFVKVLGIKAMNVPLPQNPTAVSCTLNNGIHFVTTPECRLGPDCSIEQEFELIEHNKLEFTLTLKVRRDPHIIAQFKALSHSPALTPTPVAPAPSKGGMRNFFSSSPKKSSKDKTPPQPPHRLPENLARYLKPDGTLARAFISFKDIAGRCDTRLFETSYPLIGQRTEVGNVLSTLQIGEIVLQLFRLPPLPGIPPSQLPQSLEECHRGLRHINWHKVTYFEGTLTQNGGDCMSWRRRQLRIIGANLVAFNDVTRKATATIDLRKAIAVEDDQDVRENVLSPASQSTSRSRFIDEYDGLYGVERSFRLIFPQDQEIFFFADTDDEKAKWLEVLRALVGHIPPHPLWAELLWQRQDELSKRSQAQPS